METRLHKFFSEIAFDYPCAFSLKELSSILDEESISIIKQLDLLRESIHIQSVFCSNCGNDHKVHYNGKNPYIVCSSGEYIPIDRNSLNMFRFDIPTFISLFLKAIPSNNINFVEKVSGLLWDLGNHTLSGKSYHLFFTRNISDLKSDSIAGIITNPNSVIFYLGAADSYLPHRILWIPILNIVSCIESEGLVLATETLKSYFPEASIAQPQTNLLICGNLQIDQDQCTIRYGNNEPLEISTDDKYIKFLVILMTEHRIVKYVEIAERLGMNCYFDGAINKDVARDVQLLRKEVREFLMINLSMPDMEIQKMIITKRNLGYILRCPN